MLDATTAASDSSERRLADVLIVGGGPAAATAARLLALWGRQVVVVARPETAADLPESLTPSCRKFFDLLGITAAVEAAGFVPSHGHTVWWGGTERVEPFAAGQHGWQVTTGRLSRVMLDAARAAGARVDARQVTADEVLTWPARFRIDASGRAGVLARPFGQRIYEPGHRTVALIGTWRRAGAWPVPDPSHTLLESYADGWGWSVPAPGDVRAVAVMVDPRTTQLARGGGARAVYLAEIAKMPHLGAVVRDAELIDGPSGWDASMYLADSLTGDGWLLAGDAASFVDPLSSAGAKKAMASGWLAAVAVNTALADPAMAPAALAFYAARERATYREFLALTRQHLRDGAPAADHPFWAGRGGDTGRGFADAAPGAASEPGAGSSPDDRHAVLAAYERLRAADRFTLRVAGHVTFAPRPALTDRAVVFEERLVTPLVPDGIRHVEGVDIVALMRATSGVHDVPGLLDAYAREGPPADLHDFLKALSTALARGWLLGV